MNIKKCPYCGNNNCIRKGKQKGIQRWLCNKCKLKFQANRKPLPNKEEVFYCYTFNKQTLNELNKVYHVGTKNIQRILDNYELKNKVHNPRYINLVVDATYFGLKGTLNSFCLIVFRDSKQKENLWWKFVDTEKESYYIEGRRYLEELGYVIKSVTGDGLSLIRSAFLSIQYQMCHIHMERIIVRGTTRDPILEAGKVLLALIKTIKYTKKELFIQRLKQYTERYINFLNERYYDYSTNKYRFVHEKLRSSYVSLCNLLPYLFTFKSDSNIPRTTNSLEGHFRMIKVKVATHHGLSVRRKQKIITLMLLGKLNLSFNIFFCISDILFI